MLKFGGMEMYHLLHCVAHVKVILREAEYYFYIFLLWNTHSAAIQNMKHLYIEIADTMQDFLDTILKIQFLMLLKPRIQFKIEVVVKCV